MRREIKEKQKTSGVPLGMEDERVLADYQYFQTKEHSQVYFVGFTMPDGQMGEIWLPVEAVQKAMGK
jgi:hypothetical protein